MNCLVVSATAKEIAPFIDWYRENPGPLFPYATIDVLISGIGLTATTYHLTRQVQLRRPHLVIQAGVGGAIDKKLPLGGVVAIRQDTIADQSVVELKRLRTLFDLKLVPHDRPPYTKGWLVNSHKNLLKKSKLKPVKGITVNEISTSKERIRFYEKTFGAAVESMEGAALHYVCLSEKIPFLQLRSISNYIGERNKQNWNMQDSIGALNRELIRLLRAGL